MIKIENEHLLTDRFGHWPSFHDAEIVRARFERRGPDAPFMECDIHVHEMTNDVDSIGHYVLKHHTLVTFRFCNIDLDYFESWNQQNVLFDLHIRLAEQVSQHDQANCPIQVEMDSSYGCRAKFGCRSVKIIKAEDFPK